MKYFIWENSKNKRCRDLYIIDSFFQRSFCFIERMQFKILAFFGARF